MKRRKFFQMASTGVEGLGLATSCSNIKGTDESGNNGGQASYEAPDYRAKIKTSSPKVNTRNTNDAVVLALIGAGSYGTNLVLQAAGLNANARIKYVCDVDDTRGGRAIGELKKNQGFEPIRVRDMRKVFDDKEVDGVFITNPEYWHALATIWACQAGKDVYVEKCISHDIYEGQQMIKAAMKYDRIVQCGTQNRSAGYALTARDYIKSGELGEIVAVHVRELLGGPEPFNEKEDSPAPDTIDWDMWLGPAPKVPYNVSHNKSWGYYWDYSGGYAMSGGITHQLDLARLVLDNPGFPLSVYCAGGRYFFDDNREVPDYQMATFDYGNFVLTLQAGTCTPYMAKSSPEIRFGDGFPEWTQNATRIEILGTKRMMYVGRMGGGWQVLDQNGEVVAQESGLFPLNAHIANYIDCIRTRNQPNGNIVEGYNSAVMIHLANLSYRTGNKQLQFSPEYEAVLNDAAAQKLAYPAYRKGFEIPNEV
jgi:predicted dehydrogenase